MKRRLPKISLITSIAISFTLSYQPLIAAERAMEIEEVITIGTRSSKERSASDSPVPVDVISADDFNAIGGSADLTDNLRALVPSYTATPATGDGSAFVRPTSLRGLAADQTLVLVNGKRRHRSALVQFFAPAAGNGAHAADIGMIPGIALKRVEVLRDGAAAQYGSDAIAGVINFVTKDASEGGSLSIQTGEHFEGEGSNKIAANVGLPLPMGNGFLNVSAEFMENEALSRGVIRPDALTLVNAGLAGVGEDSPFGDEPFTQTWGRPETSGVRLFANASVEISDNASLYLFGNIGKTEGRYRFFYRNPDHSSLAPLRLASLTDVGLPVGYTPFLDGDQEDRSLVAGVEGEFTNGLAYDFSFGYGENTLDYKLFNTTNNTLGLVGGVPAQRDFDVGGYEQEELNLNADFSYPLSDTLNVAFGTEWREETYTINEGEPNSFVGSGSNGLRGFGPQDAGEFDRDNYALYGDLEYDYSQDLLVQFALRYEDFDDFGSTVNGKLAARYHISDTVALRGAISSGFHAPTPGQSNVKTTITTFDGATGLQVEEGLIRPTDPDAVAAGGQELKEEESFNISAGITADLGGNTTLTLDIYKIEVDDKIYRTRDINTPNGTISFYTNAIDIESQGVDLVVTSSIEWGVFATTDLSFAFSYNKVDVVDQATVGGIVPVADSIVEDIENNYPNERFVLTANTYFGDKWTWMVRANYYGEHFDERGTIGAAVNPSAEIDATIYVDTEVNYQFNDNFRFTAGAVNVFDEFIDTIGAPNANRLSVGLQYPRRSAANYEGGAFYFRGQYSF